MIYSLLGQSEVLTISGTVLLLNHYNIVGSCMIIAGIIGAMSRYGSNMGIVQKHLGNNESHAED